MTPAVKSKIKSKNLEPAYVGKVNFKMRHCMISQVADRSG
jgi:hypothetical protein